MKKIIRWLCPLLIIVWLALSYGEVIKNNNSATPPAYSAYNAFVLLNNLFTKD